MLCRPSDELTDLTYIFKCHKLYCTQSQLIQTARDTAKIYHSKKQSNELILLKNPKHLRYPFIFEATFRHTNVRKSE